MTTVGIILVLVAWSLWSLPSDDLSDFGAADVQAAPENVAEATAPVTIPEPPAVEIQNAAAVSTVDPIRDTPRQPARASVADRVN